MGKYSDRLHRVESTCVGGRSGSYRRRSPRLPYREHLYRTLPPFYSHAPGALIRGGIHAPVRPVTCDDFDGDPRKRKRFSLNRYFHSDFLDELWVKMRKAAERVQSRNAAVTAVT